MTNSKLPVTPGTFLKMCLFWAICVLVQPALAAGEVEYRIGAGDIIRISVFQNPELTTEARVGEQGAITFPLIGKVGIGGLPLSEAERQIGERLRDGGFVVNPQVSIMLMQIRSSQVAVLGQVGRPGRYPLETTDIRLIDMLAIAGGVAPAGADVAVLNGYREGKPISLEIDIPRLLLNAKFEENIALQGGDIIYVHRAPVFYIYGEIQRPGSYRLDRDMTV
ncbi:MAG: polysaccharide export protein EpsE, partial [Sulfuritalea sp.]|nr:polysaccharide export protein EpsE [Sulfuritalea sp.]